MSATIKTYNNFVKGFITEAGPLNFPENASIDEENCVLNREGSRQRRLGMDLEDTFVFEPVTILSDDAVKPFRWYNAANDTDLQFVCVQAGTDLLIYDANEVSTSSNLLTTLDLSTYTDGKSQLEVASGLGFLICATTSGDPFYVSYDPVLDAFAINAIDMQIRDLFGVYDGLDVDENPTTLSDEHEYNLRNQGWSMTNITAYETAQSQYPSNAQQWHVGKDANEDFVPAQLDKMDFGTTPAPKGRFIINAFNRDASREAATSTTLPDDTENGRPSAVTFAFQRSWFAGIESNGDFSQKSPNMTGFVFYSRVIRDALDFNQYYSDADPTSEIDSDLVETDGGWVNIPDSGKIHKLLPKGDTVLVMAENGIWAIRGGSGGFAATDHTVIKITDFGLLSPTSVVDCEDQVFYWNRGGIYIISPDSNSGFLTASNFTENTIQTYYNTLNQAAKLTAVGTYDPINRRLMWMYNADPDYDATSYANIFTNELVFDLVLGAFTKNSITALEEDSPFIAGYIDMPDFLLRKEGVRTRGETVTKYLVLRIVDDVTGDCEVSFSYYRDPNLRDWFSYDGTGASFSSFLVAGWDNMGDIARNKSAAYIFMHFKRTETEVIEGDEPDELVFDNPSAMNMQTRWEWTDSGNTGKWCEPFNAYRWVHPYTPVLGPVDYGYPVIVTKNRIPGRGRSLSIRMDSVDDNDFYLYGWAIKYTGAEHV